MSCREDEIIEEVNFFPKKLENVKMLWNNSNIFLQYYKFLLRFGCASLLQVLNNLSKISYKNIWI